MIQHNERIIKGVKESDLLKWRSEICAIMDEFANSNQTLQAAFDGLYERFGGHNKDEELFDFYYADILIPTICFDESEGKLRLSKSCEVWSKDESNADYNWDYEWNEHVIFGDNMKGVLL